MKGKTFNTRTLVTMGLLLALEIVLSRFLSINAWNIKIGFNFVPVAVAALLYGPLGGAIVAAMGDFLGAILFPIGPYFPGFTFTAFLTGGTCGGTLRIPAVTPNDIEDICCKPKLVIRGKGGAK